MKISSLILILAVSSPVLAHAAETAESPRQLLKRADVLQRKDKKSAEPWLLRGQAYEAMGKKGKALSTYAKALKRDPLLAEAYGRRGAIYEDLKKLDEAANEYQAALKADAGYAPAKKALDRLAPQTSETAEK